MRVHLALVKDPLICQLGQFDLKHPVVRSIHIDCHESVVSRVSIQGNGQNMEISSPDPRHLIADIPFNFLEALISSVRASAPVRGTGWIKIPRFKTNKWSSFPRLMGFITWQNGKNLSHSVGNPIDCPAICDINPLDGRCHSTRSVVFVVCFYDRSLC
ncbi:hypothetical protein CEXT_517431 [Caerostris extrusa]|uniref:Uncharacterized protein n=1 Tax=Caerostris extrusa TaxID=172846 RepID=A0AAV4W611_CAEEX|nr:hypothetical protein CEXT_517431 [Caerostris extrusa]